MRPLRLVLITAVALVGCRTAQDSSSTSTSVPPAADQSPAARDFAEALAHYSQALLYEHARPPRLSDALEHYHAAARLDPTRLTHFLKTAEMQYRTGDMHATIATMRAAVGHHPDSFDAQIKLAAFAQIGAKPQLASRACAEAIRLEPARAMPYARLAFLMLQRDKPLEAKEALDRGFAASEDTDLLLDTYPHVANVLRASGHTDEANLCLATVAEHRPGNLKVREQLITSYLQLNRLAQARDALAALAADKKLHPDGYASILADLYERAGDKAGALSYLKAAVDVEAPDPKASLRLAVVYLQMEQYQDAIEILERVAGDSDDYPLLFALMGEIYEKLERPTNAVEAYEKACRNESASSTPFLRLALLFLRMERGDDAEQTLLEARKRFPDDTDVPTIIGWIHFVEDRHEKAIEQFETVDRIAQRLDIADKDLHDMYLFWFASSCERNREYVRSEVLFRRCIQAQPDNHQAYNYVAYMWAELNQNLQEAHQFVLKALEQDPANAAYLDTLGWIYYRRNEHADAEREIRRALEHMPEDPTILEHLGDVLVARDRLPHAREAWERSFRLNPKNQSLADKLREHGVDPDALREEIEPTTTPPAAD